MAAYIDMSRVPYIPGRLHATNHPYQRYGPKGFMEIKVLPNDDLYVRVDLPGCLFSGEETLGDGDVREYSGTAGLGCDCCVITGVEAKMKDGVLRMILSRVKVKDHDNKCTHFLPPNTGKSGRYDLSESPSPYNMVEVEDHPFVVKGRKSVLATKGSSDGCHHFSVDLPGVCSDDMFVLPNENEIKFYGENKEVYERELPYFPWSHQQACILFRWDSSFEPRHRLGRRVWCSQSACFTSSSQQQQ
ncbi:hypothetical protein Bca52824_096804 [Brassica carinata]|uniref:SHSP domain-containing protein n=1 Tax=Brassica carinata TaxID=52824 RepID=A0A8X7NYW9_BRACI|nr:hypothetical protein Bca52824_096804 [Brassica carinata]